MYSKLLAFFLMVGLCYGQAVSVVYTNNVTEPLGVGINPTIYMQRGDELRHRNIAVRSDGALQPLDGQIVRYEIVSGPTMSIEKTNVTYAASILSTGVTQIIQTPSLPAGEYYVQFKRYQANNTTFLGNLSLERLVVTNAAAATSCPDIYIGAGYSNLTEEGSGNVVTQLTASGTTLTVRRGTVSGGGGGGIVSNVTEGTENSWDAGTGSLVINTNPPTSGGGGTANPAWNYTADSLDPYAASVEYVQTTNALGVAFSALSTDASTEEPVGDRAGVVVPQAATNLVWTLSGYGVVTAALSVVTRYATNDAAAWSTIETNDLGASLTEVADYQWTTLVSLAAGDLVVWSIWPKQATGDFRTRALRLEAR